MSLEVTEARASGHLPSDGDGEDTSGGLHTLPLDQSDLWDPQDRNSLLADACNLVPTPGRLFWPYI